ncbi:MAG: right-handed parallel beta-helix repeat-containing protein, partial [Bacteroidia bacterium]
MKRFLLLPLTGFIFCFLFSTSKVKAQLDSTVFDYDAFTSCFACGDNLAYNVNGTKDSLTDATPNTHFLSMLKVKYKMFSCYSGTLSLTLNGTTVGTATAAYNCACNACDSLVFNISAANIKTYYKYGQKNVFRLVSPSSGLYMDRCVVYRFKSKKSNYDAGIVSVDSPAVYVCPSSKSIKLTINNGGRKAFTGVDVAWKWNGTSQTTVTHSGTLDTTGGSGSNTAQITLGTKTFTKGKKDTLMAWTRNPGGIVDSTNFNDTVRHIFYGSYGDTIRIGGSAPHYATIQAAVNELMSNGVCAPVYIKLWPGTYNEQVTINNIPGTSTSNFIMFLSKNNDSASTVINYSASSSLNYTLRLNNVKNILFHRITIEALNSTYGTVVSMIGGIENISFNRCALLGVATSSTSSSRSVINRSYTNVSDKTLNLVFTQSRIHQGSMGIYLNNSYSNYLYGLYIRNCVFENQSYMNLQCSYAKNIGISNNLFDRNGSSAYYGYGILLQNTEDSMTIVSNRILQRNGGYAFYIYNATGKSTKRNLIANNFISVYSTLNYSNDYGIYNYYNQYTDFVNNSILRHSASTDGYAFSLEEGSNNRVWYNNVENKNQGKAFNINSGSNNSVLKSDRNNFYNGGADIGFWYGNTIKTITDIKTKVQQDSNSVSNDPNFSSTTDLHAYGVDIDGRARPYSGITKDIDGETRNATTPDIGADEFNLLALDIGVVDVLPTLTGTNCLKVVLRNMGTTTVTSAKIDWKINGVAKTQINWSGSLAKGDTDIVCLGNILFKRDTLYTLVAWSSAPNTGTDLLKSNDTLDENFYPSMNGIYTIGGTTPDFASFGAAVSSLSNAGLIDSVYFKVRNGTYTEQIELGDIDGANHKNSIIFESESKDSSKVILQYATSAYSNNFVVYLNGTNGVTFRKITLQNQTASSYRTVVLLNNTAANSRFENNVIQNNDSTSTDYYSSLVKMEYNQGSEINFVQNIFNKGSYGLYFYGNSSGRDDGVKIQKNIFKKQSYQPLYLYYLKNIEISNNTITSASNNVNSGLSFGNFERASSVFNNKIDISGGNAYYGMYIYGFYSSTDTFRLYNNFVTVGGSTSGNGIYLSDIYPGTIYYNNVLNNCKDSSSSSAAFNFSGCNLKVYNNNFIHKANGYSIYTNYIDIFKSNFN